MQRRHSNHILNQAVLVVALALFAMAGACVELCSIDGVSIPCDDVPKPDASPNPPEPELLVETSAVDFGVQPVGLTGHPQTVHLKNIGKVDLTVTGFDLTGDHPNDFSFEFGRPIVLSPGDDLDLSGRFIPKAEGTRTATLTIESDDPDVNPPVALTGRGTKSAPVAFGIRAIFGSTSQGGERFENPTSLCLGPDGCLYVAQQNGLIHRLVLDEHFNVSQSSVIAAIHDTPNVNEDGTAVPDVHGRQTTGIAVGPESTAEHPVLYVTHSDPRIGNLDHAAAPLIDTDGGMLTRLEGPDFDEPANRRDLIVGLARSRENHAANGLQFGPDGWLYIANGGNTNYGAPSQQFGNHPEVALSAVILRFNPGIMRGTVDVSAGSVIGSKAGDGETAGIFEVFASGYRNAYDLLWHSNGQLYANVNEGNAGFGNTPGPECGNGVSINPGFPPDKMFAVTPGAYGGHPNPARGYCIYGDGSAYDPPKSPEPGYTPPLWLYERSFSTNGMAEYTASVFDGEMLGDIIVVSTFGGHDVRRLKLGADGFTVVGSQVIGSGFKAPLDVAVHSSGAVFVAEYLGDRISLLEPIGARASLVVDPGGTLSESSSFVPGSFVLRNTSAAGQEIERVRIDLSTSVLPDMVFDTDGQGGDVVGKSFTVDSDPGIGTIDHQFLGPHDGGFDVLEASFVGFEPGMTLTFSADIDPNSIKGTDTPGPGGSGKVAGLELVGATITVEFDNGIELIGKLFRKDDSETGGAVFLAPVVPAAPTLARVPVGNSPAEVSDPEQDIRIEGPPGAGIRLLVFECALFTENGGFNVAPFDANTMLAFEERRVTLGADGTADVALTLSKSDPSGGIHYLTAVVEDPFGQVGALSNVLILQLAP